MWSLLQFANKLCLQSAAQLPMVSLLDYLSERLILTWYQNFESLSALDIVGPSCSYFAGLHSEPRVRSITTTQS